MHKLAINKDDTLFKMDLQNSLINNFKKSWWLSFTVMHNSVEGLGITGDESLDADSEVKGRF